MPRPKNDSVVFQLKEAINNIMDFIENENNVGDLDSHDELGDIKVIKV